MLTCLSQEKTHLSNPVQSDIFTWICICSHRYRTTDQPARPVPTQSEKNVSGENAHTQNILTKIHCLYDEKQQRRSLVPADSELVPTF